MNMMTLLVVDDESLVRSFVRAVLEREKLPVAELLEAGDGNEAVSLCRRRQPQAVLMDLCLPTMGGLEAISIIVKEFPKTYVTVISAHEDFNLVRRSFQLGVKDYLLKPVGAEELSALIRKIHNDLAAAPGLKPGHGNDLVRAVAQFINEHISEPFSTPDLARSLYISPAHLCRKFKKLTGQSLGEFITERRLAMASELLTDSSLSVTEIAAQVGFENPGYFATYFKAHTGQSPSGLRHQYQRETANAG